RCTFFKCPRAACVYTCVVAISACPSKVCTLRRSAPCSTICVAQLCRSICGLALLPPAVAPLTISQTHCRVSAFPRTLKNNARATDPPPPPNTPPPPTQYTSKTPPTLPPTRHTHPLSPLP